jgi:hypothetical protein
MHAHKKPPGRQSRGGYNQNRRQAGTRPSERRPISKKRPTNKNNQVIKKQSTYKKNQAIKKRLNHKNSQSIKNQPNYKNIRTNANNRRRIAKNTRIKPEEKIKYVQDVPHKKVPFPIYFFTFFAFILGIITLTAGANVTLQRVQNSELESELTSLLNLNSSLTLELSGDLDMIEIEYRARTNLNMSEPLPHQIILIELAREVTPDVDFTLPPQYESRFFENVSGFFSRFWNFITGDIQ